VQRAEGDGLCHAVAKGGDLGQQRRGAGQVDAHPVPDRGQRAEARQRHGQAAERGDGAAHRLPRHERECRGSGGGVGAHGRDPALAPVGAALSRASV
jgi:hypothetical protein